MSFMSTEIRSTAPRLTARRVRQGASVASAALLLSAALTGCAGSAKADSDAIQASGSTTVAPVASDAAEALKAKGLNITVATQGGSAGGISQLGTGQINIALSSKPLSDKDHKAYPGTDFVAAQIGADAVGVIITREVADGGVKSLSKAQVAGLFEGRITNWKAVGGPDLQVFVYDKEPGRGTREVLDKFIYGKGEPPAPPKSANYAIVGGNLETRNKLKSTRGSIAPLSTGFIDGHPDLVAVPLEGVAPTLANVASGKYPMARPLYMLTNGRPKGTVKQYIDYVLSPEGQKLLPEHGYLTREQMGL